MEKKEKLLRSLEGTKEHGNFKRFNYNKEKSAKLLSGNEIAQFKKQISQLILSLSELEFITIDETNEIVSDLLKKAKKAEVKIRELLKDENSINEELKDVAMDLHDDISKSYKIIKRKNQVKSITDKKVPIRKEIIEKIAQYFHSSRKGKDITSTGVSVFDFNIQNGWNEGDYLMAFKENMSSPFVHTYGVGKDVEACQNAKEKGVDRVAKAGIDRMSNNTFDIVMHFRDDSSFHGVDNFPWTLNDLRDFRIFLDRKAVRGGGYVLFNIPYYKIPHFEARINLQLKVEAIFRTDDEMGNMIFVTTFKKADELFQKKLLKKAFRMPHKIPHYTENEEFHCNKGLLTLPEIFEGNVKDERDYQAAFKNEVSAFEQIRGIFKPKETIVELSNPLQKYRLAHIGGVAASGAANGIYDTSLYPELVEKGFKHPHILSFKIVKKDVKTVTTDTVAGEECEVESWQETHSIVMEVLYPDGKIKEFLNTDKEKEKTSKKKEKTTKKSKEPHLKGVK